MRITNYNQAKLLVSGARSSVVGYELWAGYVLLDKGEGIALTKNGLTLALIEPSDTVKLTAKLRELRELHGFTRVMLETFGLALKRRSSWHYVVASSNIGKAVDYFPGIIFDLHICTCRNPIPKRLDRLDYDKALSWKTALANSRKLITSAAIMGVFNEHIQRALEHGPRGKNFRYSEDAEREFVYDMVVDMPNYTEVAARLVPIFLARGGNFRGSNTSSEALRSYINRIFEKYSEPGRIMYGVYKGESL